MTRACFFKAWILALALCNSSSFSRRSLAWLLSIVSRSAACIVKRWFSCNMFSCFFIIASIFLLACVNSRSCLCKNSSCVLRRLLISDGSFSTAVSCISVRIFTSNSAAVFFVRSNCALLIRTIMSCFSVSSLISRSRSSRRLRTSSKRPAVLSNSDLCLLYLACRQASSILV